MKEGKEEKGWRRRNRRRVEGKLNDLVQGLPTQNLIPYRYHPILVLVCGMV